MADTHTPKGKRIQIKVTDLDTNAEVATHDFVVRGFCCSCSNWGPPVVDPGGPVRRVEEAR
jgi:hypothetical protein